MSLVPELPRVTIALAKHHFTHELIEATDAFCMHLIDEDQNRLGVAFWNSVRPRGRQTSRAGNFDRRQRCADFDGRAAWLDCRVEARMDTGDRTVYVAEVLDAGCGTLGVGQGDPLSGPVRGQETRVQPGTPLTFKRLLKLRRPTSSRK